MNSLIKTTIKRPVTICILVIVLMAVGVLATLDMSTNLLPNIKMPMVGISVVYPGASAQSVEEDVTSVIDSALQTVPGITDLQTISYDNASVVVLTFDYGTDVDEKIETIKEAFAAVTFPDACTEPSFIKIDMNGTATATISVYNEQGDLDALYRDANALATKLGSIEGVGSVNIFGKPEKQVKITALNGLDVTALLIVQALTNEGLNIPLGTVMQDGSTVAIRNASDATSLLDIMRLPVDLSLSASAVSSFATLKQLVKAYAYMSKQDFDDYVELAQSARELIDEIESKTAIDLREQQQGLAAVKSLMTLVKSNTAFGLEVIWTTAIDPIVTNDSFLNMSDDELRNTADTYGLNYDLLKWVQDNANDGTLKADWDKIVDFRSLVDEKSRADDTDYEITYDNFADLFQNGGSLSIDQQEKSFEGLDLLHSDEHSSNCNGSGDCDRKTYTHDQAVDVCQFANSVNTVAFSSIVQTVEDGEEISDAQFAALFVNTTQGNDFAALMSPQVIHIIRLDKFDDGTDTSIVSILTAAKYAHVNSSGNAVFAKTVSGQKVEVRMNNGELVVDVNGKDYFVNSFGRLVDADGNLVDDDGNVLTLSDEQLAANYYTYGGYVVFTDSELVKLYNDLYVAVGDDLDFGLTPTLDTVRFARICDFSGSSMIVPLAYVGRVESFDNYQAYAQYNGILSVTIEVYAVSDANTTDVVNRLKQALASTQMDSRVVLLDDKAEFINDSISNVLFSIVIGGVLAVLVIYLFVKKVGSSLVVSITMPLSVLVALIGLWAMNISINLVSLGGLAVGIGMLVDNSIVVLESITKHRDSGESVADSCLNGTREVAGSLFASTLTNVCVFFPILFARGLTREIFYDLVWAVLFSIVMSLVVAVTVIPSLYNLIYRNSHSKTVKQRKVAKFNSKVNISRMEQGYGKVLSKVLTKRVWVCVVALVLFVASVGLVFTTGMEFMPGVDKGVIEVNVDYDASVSLDEATASSKEIVTAIQNAYGDKLTYVALTVGKQGLLATSNSGVVRIQTDTSKLKTADTVQEIRKLISALSVNAQSVTVREMDGVIAEVTGGMSNQSVALLSDDMEVLRTAAAAVTSKLLEVDPEHIVNAVNNTPIQTDEILFTFDRMACVERGVDYQMAVMLLRVGMSGYDAATVKIDNVSQAVTVQFDDATVKDVQSLLDVVVGFDNDGAVQLRDVLKQTDDGAYYTTRKVDSTINRQNGKYTTTIDLEIYGIDSGTIGKVVDKAVSEVLADYPEVTYQDSGVTSYLNDAFQGLVISLVAAFVLLYSVMACQFESLTKPFVVIMSIPFSFTGGFLALAITGMTLNVVSFVGIIMLMGVIVNGAIVMIDKINQLTDAGLTPQQAVIEGCKSRLRPILMTTLTTILALVPLALGLGRGGELMQPMGIVVLGGLLLGTLVTLVLIPCFYCIIKRIKFVNKDKPATEIKDEASAVATSTETADSQ